MDSSHENEFKGRLIIIGDIWRREVSEHLASVYWNALKDIPAVDVFKAMDNAVAQCEFFPVPAVIRKLAGDVVGEDRAEIAWHEAFKALKRIGAYGSPQFDDLAITATIRSLGGWKHFCDMKVDERVWTKKEFKATYGAMSSHGVHPADAQPLIGIHDANNITGGFKTAPDIEDVDTGLGTRRVIRPPLQIEGADDE